MKYLKLYHIFEAEIYGRTQNFKNQSILDDIRDMINDLEEDTHIEYRLWVNNQNFHQDTIRNISIELNHDGLFVENELNEFIERLKSYLHETGRVRTTYTDDQFLELNINIFK